MSGSRSPLLGDWFQPPDDPQANVLLRQMPLAPRPSYAAAADQAWAAIQAKLEEQQRISQERGLWTGGQAWEGGHPTTKGVADAAQQVASNFEGGIKAFHGSPHSFERFDTSKIGTGEGAQAYGHGLYFAENEGVAQGYKRDLAQTITVDGKPILQSNKVVGSTGDRSLDDILIAHGGDLDSAIADHKSHMATLTPGQITRGGVDRQLAQLEALRGRVDSRNTGHMYEVDINADPERMLHWDKPLSEQSQYVRDALSKLSPDLMPHLQGTLRGALDNPNGPAATRFATGDRIYRELADAHSRMAGDPTFYETPQGKAVKSSIEGAAQTLREAGIPGIRYLDQNSRTAGEGTHNVVVFDADTINLLRKYGIAGLGIGLGATATQGGE